MARRRHMNAPARIASDSRCDEVAALAQLQIEQHGARALHGIDEQILRVMAEGNWDEMSKWHRVRLRVIRLQQASALAQQLSRACGPS